MVSVILAVILALMIFGCEEPEPSIPSIPSGSIIAWGLDDHGQVSNTPEGDDFIAVSANQKHSLALRRDGSIAAWGYDSRGQVSDTPAGRGFVAISAGYGHNLALHRDGSIVAWGLDMSDMVSNSPAGNDFIAVAAGFNTSMALRGNGSVFIWGGPYGAGMELEDADQILYQNNFRDIAINGPLHMGLTDLGQVVTWGDDQMGSVYDNPLEGTFIGMAAGPRHGVAIAADSSIVAWGWDMRNEVSSKPVGTGFVSVSVGYSHSLALHKDGTLTAWGWSRGGHGQLEDTPDDSGYFFIDAGTYHNIALRRPDRGQHGE